MNVNQIGDAHRTNRFVGGRGHCREQRHMGIDDQRAMGFARRCGHQQGGRRIGGFERDQDFEETAQRELIEFANFNEREPTYQQRQGGEDFKIKVDIPNFTGNLNADEFLDWLMEVERFFELMGIAANKRVKYAAYKLKGIAGHWWQQIQEERFESGLAPIVTWDVMKMLLEERFLPDDYEQTLFEQYQEVSQENRSVQDFYRLAERNKLKETKA